MIRHSDSTAIAAGFTQCHPPRLAGWIALPVLVASLLVGGPMAASAQQSPQLAMTTDAAGGDGGLFSARRSLGVAFLAGSAFLALQGNDFKDEADRFYDQYEAATDPDEIAKFYQRTTNRDVKSQVSWALAAAFGITGLRLVLTGNDSGAAQHLSTVQSAPALTVAPNVTPRVVGLRLQSRFY